MQVERGEVGGTQAQATPHRDESPGWESGFYFNGRRKLRDFKSGGDYTYIYFIFRNQKEIHQWVNRDHQWVGEGHE